MVLHASGGARAAERKPALAADAAQTIRDAARTALAEVDELVDSSQPVGASLDGLTDLAESAAAAGLGVALAVDPDLPPLDATVESVAYRVVREALTNAVKHAAPAEVLVKVRWSGDALEVEVADSGRSRDARERERTALAAAGGGHGLVGMNERVTRAGGSLEAGLRPEGGFVVRASLPAHGGRTVDERSPGRQEPAWNTESSAIRA